MNIRAMAGVEAKKVKPSQIERTSNQMLGF
jgi:hypothetical protein